MRDPQPLTDWNKRLRERLAAEGVVPSAHREAIDEIAEHLNDLHRAAEREGKTPVEADAVVEAELARMGPLAMAVSERARRRRPTARRPATAGGPASRPTSVTPFAIAASDRSFSAIVILTLAIGIGACTAVFSIVNSLLLGPLPYPDPDGSSWCGRPTPTTASDDFIVAHPVYEDWQRETRSSSRSASASTAPTTSRRSRSRNRSQGMRASASLFTVLGVPPAIGRVFTEEEDASGEKLAVISDACGARISAAIAARIGRRCA